jgi:acyl-CoA synthetase (NDP forming)
MQLPIDKLMAPQSVAIVGVSERPEAIGTRVLNNLRLMGFSGPIYPVNPRLAEIGGVQCYPNLSALPRPVDAAFLAVPAPAGPDLVEEAGRCGIRAVFINANGYADGDANGAELQRRIQASAAKYGMAICGPNNLGLINVHDCVAMWAPRYMKLIDPGPIGVIAQSGSIALILSQDERDLGFAYLITTGNEAVAGVADYLSHMVRDDRVSVILLFLETIRDPRGFYTAAIEAARRGKQIIALKLGTSAEGRTLVQAHTGSLAGEDRLYDAFFKAVGIIRVRDLDEMLETAVLIGRNSAVPPARRCAIVTFSGGEAALIADIGEELGLTFPKLSQETLSRLIPAFPPYSSIGNPLDAWGLGFNSERFRTVLHALLADPQIDLVAFSIDAPGRGGSNGHYACDMAEACVTAQTDKRLVFFKNTAGAGVNAEVRKILGGASIPYLAGMRSALAAIRNLSRLQPVQTSQSAPGLARASGPLPSSEPERFRVLRDHGVPMVPAERALTAREAVAVAERFGYPVAMKGVAPHLPHKSDLGLVELGLTSAQDVADAFASLSEKLAKYALPSSTNEIVVQKMADCGVELIVGVRNEKGFGSFVIVGPGGVLVEISNQASVRLGPVTEEQVQVMIRETAAGKLLAGVRGKPACDIDAAAAAIAAFSRFGAAQIDRLAVLEINPLIVGVHGAAGVDLLIEPNAGKASEVQE